MSESERDLDGRIGNELKRTNDEEEHVHDIFVAFEHFIE